MTTVGTTGRAAPNAARPGPIQPHHERETSMTTTTDTGTASSLVRNERAAIGGGLTDAERDAIKSYADNLCEHGVDVSDIVETTAGEDFHQTKKTHGGRAAKKNIAAALSLLGDWTSAWDDLQDARCFTASPSEPAVAFLIAEKRRLDEARGRVHANAFAFLLRSVR